jgi:hypothetical protein
MLRREESGAGVAYYIECDDRTGGVLCILHARDGDLHFTMRHDDTQANAHEGIEQAPSVRLRTGQGGGDHPRLQLALAKALMTHGAAGRRETR